MAEFRQKNFIAPFLATAAKSIFSMNGALTGLTAGSMIQSHNQSKEQERQAEIQQRQNKKMTEAINKLAEENPGAAGQAGQLLSQNNFSFVAKAGKEVVNLAKTGRDLLVKYKVPLQDGVVAGVGMGGIAYGVDKAIQHDKNKLESKLRKQQVQYSVLSKATELVKKGGEIVNRNKGTTLLIGGLMSVPTVAGYLGERAVLKDQIKASSPSQGKFKQKQYATITLASIKAGLKAFKDAPVKKTLEGLSFVAGAGKKATEKFGNNLTELGKANNSTIATKTGEFLTKHPKTALAASIPVSVGVMDATWGGGQKVMEKAAKAVDKNAFSYRDRMGSGVY